MACWKFFIALPWNLKQLVRLSQCYSRASAIAIESSNLFEGIAAFQLELGQAYNATLKVGRPHLTCATEKPNFTTANTAMR